MLSAARCVYEQESYASISAALPFSPTRPSTANTLPLVRLAARRRWTISPGHARGVTPTNIPKSALLTHRQGALYHSSTHVVIVGNATLHGVRTTSSYWGVLP